MSRKHRHWAKVAGVALAVVVGYRLYESHTNGPRPVRKSGLP